MIDEMIDDETAEEKGIEVTISFKNIVAKESPTNLACKIDFVDGGNGMVGAVGEEVGISENIENDLSPSFSKRFKVNYNFEENKLLRITLFNVQNRTFDGYDNKETDEYIGYLDVSLGEIISTRGWIVKRPLVNKSNEETGFIVIQAFDVRKPPNEKYEISFEGVKLKKMDLFGKSDPYYIIKVKEEDEWKEIYKSEIIMKDLNPKWKKAEFDYSSFGGREKPFKFECWDWDKKSSDDFIGSTMMTIKELHEDIVSKELKVEKKKKKKDFRGLIECPEITIVKDEKDLLLEYFKGGMNLKVITAIDFSKRSSVWKDPRKTEFESALQSFGNALCPYSRDNLFPVYGFGAEHASSYSLTDHCFPLNGDKENPFCYGVDGMMNAFRNFRENVEFADDKSRLDVLLKTVIEKHVKKKEEEKQDDESGLVHHVLVVFTASPDVGEVRETSHQLVEASFRNLSIIFVEMGIKNFEDFRYIINPELPFELEDRDGRKKNRELMTFGNYKKLVKKTFKGKERQLTGRLVETCLENLSKQILSYCKKEELKPGLPLSLEDFMDDSLEKFVDDEMNRRMEIRKKVEIDQVEVQMRISREKQEWEEKKEEENEREEEFKKDQLKRKKQLQEVEKLKRIEEEKLKKEKEEEERRMEAKFLEKFESAKGKMEVIAKKPDNPFCNYMIYNEKLRKLYVTFGNSLFKVLDVETDYVSPNNLKEVGLDKQARDAENLPRRPRGTNWRKDIMQGGHIGRMKKTAQIVKDSNYEIRDFKKWDDENFLVLSHKLHHYMFNKDRYGSNTWFVRLREFNFDAGPNINGPIIDEVMRLDEDFWMLMSKRRGCVAIMKCLSSKKVHEYSFAGHHPIQLGPVSKVHKDCFYALTEEKSSTLLKEVRVFRILSYKPPYEQKRKILLEGKGPGKVSFVMHNSAGEELFLCARNPYLSIYNVSTGSDGDSIEPVKNIRGVYKTLPFSGLSFRLEETGKYLMLFGEAQTGRLVGVLFDPDTLVCKELFAQVMDSKGKLLMGIHGKGILTMIKIKRSGDHTFIIATAGMDDVVSLVKVSIHGVVE